MDARATQQCIEVRQEINSLEKKVTQIPFTMSLYDDHIDVKGEKIALSIIFDVSYRLPSGEKTIGFLYLHTSRGVLTYQINTNPKAFIAAFKTLVPETTFRSQT
ncbi:hypothetical protein [Shouchella lonarensis]|uniref:Uncharacterized protein n=1 Tax=Shouchella lonarensis TaxID=1464122 RepID=A0A1G6JMJ8_9BACI|nr:hypothetical protein [Shouchella lonarensis]SDC19960.1 hypothetical protein SAMN05421737_10637 [Shouchella lonarensis]